jgi:hypothetical protein
MWSALAQYPNPGQGFSDAFQQGMQRNALSALALNPTDPRAQAAAAPFAPGQVMQARQQQAELTQQEHDAWVKTLASAAKMADTPEKWDAAVDYFVSHGHAEAAQFKGKFSPGLRAAFMAQGGIADDKPAQPHFVPFQQGGGVLQVKPDGTTKMLVKPNEGGHPTGAPVAGPLTDEQMQQLLSGGQSGATPAGNF